MKTADSEKQIVETPVTPTDSKILPPVAEIARLAATLAQGKSLGAADCGIAARRAIELWLACEQEREAWISEHVTLPALRELAIADDLANSGNLPAPKAFPVGYDDFLKLSLPGKRSEDRAKIGREFIRSCLRRDRCSLNFAEDENPFEKVPIPTDDDCAKAIAKLRETGLSERVYARNVLILREFAKWYGEQNVKLRNQAAGRASAVKRKAKRKARPPMEKLKAVLLT